MSPRKNNRPSIDEYFGLEAKAYGNSQWMARNQIQTTSDALLMLEDERIGGKMKIPKNQLLFLDLGCGTGYSSHVILETQTRVVGVDFSRDMLDQCIPHENLHLIHGDMRFLPLRTKIIDHIISISAFNFITTGAHSKTDMIQKIKSTFRQIASIMKAKGHMVIEFYPTEFEQEIFLQELKLSSFDGGLILLYPNSKREKKFLLLVLKC